MYFLVKRQPIFHRFGKYVQSTHDLPDVPAPSSKMKTQKTVPGAILGACPKAAGGRFQFNVLHIQ
jgi:hypothetical protein